MKIFIEKWAFLFCILFAATACNDDSSDNGSVTVALTDIASEDLETFQVDVTSIQLRRTYGGIVTLLREPVRVDFTTLGDLSEILTIVDVPVSFYTGGTISFNWNTAVAHLNGKTEHAALLNTDGNTLTGTTALELTFPAGMLHVRAWAHRLLEFDFDLNSSVEVDLPNNTVTVAPTIFVRVDRDDPKTLITGGELAGVDIRTNVFFSTLQRPNGTPIGEVTCLTTALTVYQIDGESFVGSDGLIALASLPQGTWVQTYGTKGPLPGQVQVSCAEAGVGTIGGGTDIVDGLVTARTGGPGADPVLTVLGHSVNSTGSAVNLNTSFTVNLSLANTAVVRRGVATSYTADDINVGQAVRAFGTLAGTTLDATAPDSVLRQKPTRVFGFANGGPTGGIVDLTLTRIHHRAAGTFNFDVSGVNQADPANFLVDPGGLSLSGIGLDSALEFQGFFPAVNAAGADFIASSLTNRDTASSWLRLRFQPVSATAFSSFSATRIELDPTGSLVAVIDRGFVGTTPLPTDPAPTVEAASGFTLFVIIQDGGVAIYLNFGDFSLELEDRTQAGAKLYHFGAIGIYNESTNIIEASLASAVLD